MELKLTCPRKKIIEKFKVRYNLLNQRVTSRNLLDSKIFQFADVVFDNIRELEKTLFVRSASNVAQLVAELDRRFKTLESFVAKEETRRANTPQALIAVFMPLTERKVDPSPIFSRPIKRR